VRDIVRYKVIPCQLTNDTPSVLLPLHLYTPSVVDVLADWRVGVFKLNNDQSSKNNFVLQNTKRYSDLIQGNFERTNTTYVVKNSREV